MDTKKPPILVVDDDRDIREAVAAVLSSVGYPVLSAADGAAALEILRSSPVPVGLVILDLMMPKVDGWEFRARQKADPALRDIPVVILSAGGQVEKKAQNLEAVGWLRKPVQLEVLVQEVANAVARHPRGDDSAGHRALSVPDL